MSNYYDKGNRVRLAEEALLDYANSYGRRTISADTPGTVTSQVKSGFVNVKFDGQTYVLRVDIDKLVPDDPNAPKPRPLGEVPEGGISPFDPRLYWLWEDAGKLADKMGLCSTYDDFAKRLNIPGRPRNFTVKTKVNGFDATVVVTARSQHEADAMVLGTTEAV